MSRPVPLFTPPRRRVRAFTMIELIVVIAIISTMLGIGTGVYFAFIHTTALQAETYAIIAIIESARSTAIAEDSETFVCVDVPNVALYPFGRTKVGVWHFESIDGNRLPGAFSQSAIIAGSATPALIDGKIGKTIPFDGATSLKCKLLRGTSWVEIPTYDTREGVALEAWVMPVAAAAPKRVIIQRDGWFALWLDFDVPSSKFRLAAYAVTLDPDNAQYLKYSAATNPVIRLNEWTHVSMSCQKLSTGITLKINGVEHLETGSEPAVLPASTAETVIAAAPDNTAFFVGRIDELMISAYAVDTVHRITKKLTLEADGLAAGNTIRFDPTGKLAAVHDGTPPRLRLKDIQGGIVESTTTITVGPMGALDVQTTNH